MDTNSRWKHILLYVGALVVVIVITYLFVSAYFHVPLGSLLPSTPLTSNVPTSSPTPGVKPTSVRKYGSSKGLTSYNIEGKFVTSPTYNAANVLQSDFVIDGDPNNHRIPVTMSLKTSKINVGRSQGSLRGTTVWKLEDTESLRQSIKVNAPAQLRLSPVTAVLSKYDISVQKVMNSIMDGLWSIPDDFVLHPLMVGVVQ